MPKKSTVGQWLTWQNSTVVNGANVGLTWVLTCCWRGIRVVWRLGLTWRYERTTRVTEGARRVTWPDDMLVLQAARPASYGGYFITSESSKVRPFEWWWSCSERRLVPKIPMKAASLLVMYSPFHSNGTPQFWWRQRSKTRNSWGSGRMPKKTKTARNIRAMALIPC